MLLRIAWVCDPLLVNEGVYQLAYRPLSHVRWASTYARNSSVMREYS